MMKLLYGIYDLTSGEILIGGENPGKLTPKKSISLGIGMVHQEFMLVDELTVLENIILGFEPRNGLLIDFPQARKEVRRFIDQYGLDVQLDKRVNQISVGEAQRVEIIKVLMRGADTIILDEPTAVLTPQETEGLFRILRNIKADGKSIVFISHKLNEVMTISDRISVMRQGRHIGTVEKERTTKEDLATMMIGREVLMNIRTAETSPGEPVLRIEELWTSGEKEMSKIRGVSFEIRSGEILGVAGVDGNGQSELVEAITGLRPVERGSVFLEGRDISRLSPGKKRKAGLAHIPENRNTRGLNRSFSIMENLISSQLDERFSRHHIVDTAAADAYSADLAEAYDIRPRDPRMSTSSLSGGNAQKVVVAREVSVGSKVLIASQPTRGVDIGAIESIRNTLEDVKRRGAAILLVSADLEEILSLSDRIIVMHEGRITGELDKKSANETDLGILMMGGKRTYE